MKRCLSLVAAFLMVGSIYSCKDDPADPNPNSGNKTNAKTDDADTDDSNSESEALLLEALNKECAQHAGAAWAGCFTQTGQNDIALSCTAAGVVDKFGQCFAHSSCVETAAGITCQCADDYELTATADGEYYCKEKSNYPSEISAACVGQNNGYSACVSSGTDTWAIYCVNGQPYANDGTGNCSESHKKCGEVSYNNGKFFECVQCAADSDCTLSSSATYERAMAICDNGTCKDGCEGNYRLTSEYDEIDEVEYQVCEYVENYCRSTQDCSEISTTEGQSFICVSQKCDPVCAEDYTNRWDDNGNHYCQRKE